MEGVQFPAIARIQVGILQRQIEGNLTKDDTELIQEFSQIFSMLDEYYQLKEMYEEDN